MATVDTSDLIDSAEVARLLKLSHRNSVSTYLRRYPDFPRPAVVRGDGRINLWLRSQIESWRPDGTLAGEQEQAADRHRRALIQAARELMALKPSAEISIREIAERANLPHTLIYRHIGSKEDLERAVISTVIGELSEVVSYGDDPLANVDALLRALYSNAAGVRILVNALQSERGRREYGDEAPIIKLLVRAIADGPGPSTKPSCAVLPALSPQVAIGAATAMVIGWVAFQPRITAGTGLTEVPIDDLVAISTAIIAAAIPVDTDAAGGIG